MTKYNLITLRLSYMTITSAIYDHPNPESKKKSTHQKEMQPSIPVHESWVIIESLQGKEA